MKLPPVFVLVASLSAFVQCASPPEFDEDEWLRRASSADSALLYAPHLNDDGTFFNPWLERQKRPKSGSWIMNSRRDRRDRYDSFPQADYSHIPNDYAYLADPNFDSISYAGHASIIIKMNGQTIFTDPFFSNAAVVVRKKVRIKFDFSKGHLSLLQQKPVVLISHNHYDHLDRYSIKQFIKKGAVFIVPLGLKKQLAKWGAQEVYELDWWEGMSLGEGPGCITYTLLPAQHWSNRLGHGVSKTLWGSFLIEGSKAVYFSGDTGYFVGFKEFGRRYNIDYALLGAGAYEPRWFMHYSHMNVAEFFRAADDLGAKISIPMHFGVISLSDEPLLYPIYEVDKFVKENPGYADRVRSLRVGEYLTMGSAGASEQL